MYEMNETQLRELIAKMRSRDPNSLEARMEKTELQDAEQLLREMVSKQKSRGRKNRRSTKRIDKKPLGARRAQVSEMKITWICCRSYEEAQDYSRVIYLHEWNGKPFYWGKAENSYFGGSSRKRDGLKISARYNQGYRHWIEGCLRHGGRLYIGKLDEEALRCVDEVEGYLIRTYGHEMNSKVAVSSRQLEIEHEGDIPKSITGF